MREYKQQSSLFVSFLWMLFLSVLLCWIPLFGQFIAGFVGGKKAGSAGRAILAFFFPAIVLTVLMIFVAPLIPFLIFPMTIIMVSYNFALFCGAVVGGASA